MLPSSLRDLRLPALEAIGINKERAARVLFQVKHILDSAGCDDSCQALPRSGCS